MRPVNTAKRNQLEDVLLSDFLLLDAYESVIISEMDCNVDGSFAVHSLLSLYIKQNYNICFLSLSQSFSHYQLISQKMGTDLKVHLDANRLIVLDGLKDLGSSIIKQCVNSDRSILGDVEPSIEGIITNKNLNGLLNKILTNIQTLSSQPDGQPAVVVIDNLSVLLGLGISLEDIVQFVHMLSKQLKEKRGALVMLSTLYEEGDKSEYLMNYLLNTATTSLKVKSLPSGYCRDVHGELTITRKGKLERRKKLQKVWQFKITEKNINLMSSGLSSAVL